MRANLNLIVFALAAAALFSCKRETEEFTSEPLSDYVPLQVGKYITYRLDSTVFTDFGKNVEVHSFQEKHLVDAQYPDASGRPTYRILRYYRDVAGTQGWKQAGTYYITPTDKTVEVIENNLRFVKLALPLKKDFSWKGNQYLPEEPFAGVFAFNNDDQISDWDYKIDSVNTTVNFNGTTVSNVIKVVGIEENNVPDTIEVSSTQVQIPASFTTVYLRGNATGPVTLTAPAPTANSSNKLTIYNRTNWPVKLDTITIPVNGGKPFEYMNNTWNFGYVNGLGVRKDTLYNDLPIASRDVLIDKYAKGIGLVYQEFIMWEYQFVHNPVNEGRTNGFGVKRVMIDHN